MQDKDVLFVIPPVIQDYLNLCYNYSDFIEIASYVNKFVSVDVIDGSLGKYSWSDIIEKIYSSNYYLVVINNSRGNITNVQKLSDLIKNINPNIKVLTYGRISSMIPKHFFSYDLDAITYSGDYELSVVSYIKYLKGDISLAKANGLYIKDNNIWIKTGTGKFHNRWSLSDISLVPLNEYQSIYSIRKNNPGFSEKELTITLSRGCPTGCPFCDVSYSQGRKDRRLDLDIAINYIKNNFFKYGFNALNISSPFFTSNKEYCIDFCERMIAEDMKIEWKCVTRPDFLDEELIRLMSKAGCRRIGIGIESFSEKVLKQINKKINQQNTLKIIEICKRYNIEARCFIMVGIPSQTKEDIDLTINNVIENGGKIRATFYTPFQNLKEDMTCYEIDHMNRNIIYSSVENMSNQELYQLVYDFDSYYINYEGNKA